MFKLNKVFKITEDVVLKIKVTNCNVFITKNDKDEAVIDYEREVSEGITSSEDKISIEMKNNEIVIRENDLESKKCGKLCISIPNVSILKVNLVNGSISVKDLNSTFKLESLNAGMQLIDCEGVAKLSVSQGKIAITSFSGVIKANSDNGGIEINKGSGVLKAESINGVIRILNTGFEEVKCSSLNGGIIYDIPFLEKGNFRFSGINGKILLKIPTDLMFNLSARNKNGKFHIGLPDNYESDSDSRERKIRMVRGIGKVEISIKNENGSIVLTDEKGSESKQIPDDYSFKDMFTGSFKSGLGDLENIGKQIFSPLKNSSNEKKETMNKQGNSESVKKILEMIENGTITPDEGDNLIKTINQED